ncbi:unnamed protein product [Cyprideis torosa]|uniref:Uncharacterized protein n=1 Tax=Cyprideis torosa TaxID=163714 RepID=A0A7R8ZQY5_9CRUS|nr:unnamed protein product [Cyprideis torosa]CAG0897537.1 unnamed protein product [Cyprideis torosa]
MSRRRWSRRKTTLFLVLYAAIIYSLMVGFQWMLAENSQQKPKAPAVVADPAHPVPFWGSDLNKFEFDEEIREPRTVPKDSQINKQQQKADQISNLFQVTSKAEHVLILSYIRGGISALDQVFARNPKVFYLYEPLKLVEQTVYNIAQAISRDMVGPSLQRIHEAFHCTFQDNKFIYTEAMVQMHVYRKFFKDFCEVQNLSDEACLKHFCDDKMIRVLRVSRLQLRDLQPLLEKYEQAGSPIKVILDLEDPKLVLFSPQSAGRELMFGQARELCSRMLMDILGLQELHPQPETQFVWFHNRITFQNLTKLSLMTVWRELGMDEATAELETTRFIETDMEEVITKVNNDATTVMEAHKNSRQLDTIDLACRYVYETGFAPHPAWTSEEEEDANDDNVDKPKRDI